jgi:DNA-binding SARP family transcriptional activator
MRTVTETGMRAIPPAAARLSVHLLGRVEASVDGRQLRLGGRHAQALFALLVLDRKRRSREAIAADLWPDIEGSTSACLRQALWVIKGALSEAGIDPRQVLEIEPDVLGIREDAKIDVDVDRFEAAVRARPPDPEEAIRHYVGDLVEGLGHECFAAERERLSDSYEDSLALAAIQRLEEDRIESARDAAERLVARDPLREEAHTVLIGVHGRVGTRSQVVRQYRRLCAVLDHELQVEPLPETDVAYRDALAATVERSRRTIARRPELVPGVRPLVVNG